MADEAEIRKWIKAALGKRGSPTAFAASNGMSDEAVLGFLRGKRPLEPKMLYAIGYRKVVTYRPCNCHHCTKARTSLERGPEMLGQPLAMMRMFLCETCGNKRCPGASDHRNACSDSNEPGQPDSLYADCAQ